MVLEVRMEIARFFYKDLELAKSLRAQLFSGVIESVTTLLASDVTVSTAAKGAAKGKIEIPIIANAEATGEANMGCAKMSRKSHAETISPHDLTILDVVASLRQDMKLSIDEAEFGDVVYVKGLLYIFPVQLESVCMEAAMYVSLDAAVRGAAMPKQMEKGMRKFIENSVKAPRDDPRFVFTCDNDNKICSGFLKNEGLTDSQLSIFYKHGASPIPVHMIAVSEKNPGRDGFQTENTFFGQMFNLSTQVQKLWEQGMPPSTPVTPICLFHPIKTQA